MGQVCISLILVNLLFQHLHLSNFNSLMFFQFQLSPVISCLFLDLLMIIMSSPGASRPQQAPSPARLLSDEPYTARSCLLGCLSQRHHPRRLCRHHHPLHLWSIRRHLQLLWIETATYPQSEWHCLSKTKYWWHGSLACNLYGSCSFWSDFSGPSLSSCYECSTLAGCYGTRVSCSPGVNIIDYKWVFKVKKTFWWLHWALQCPSSC